ncbi:neprosin family prolyl endopeptidase [Paractinoplanes rishiriensis]|uniref:Neprosin PEP catalytic domain-containing protein n=1 Tax=Paractinoplanes rishiriensis TaxID=1050105 RepID=A0A919MZ36_9ACTN|nr:neprosin family prolyl endopeptidase [Actinoplanes rishiriensis]GIF00720.1 hypothetical protein Ari01nite_81840 [Actinoplanes rishiriensis]
MSNLTHKLRAALLVGALAMLAGLAAPATANAAGSSDPTNEEVLSWERTTPASLPENWTKAPRKNANDKPVPGVKGPKTPPAPPRPRTKAGSFALCPGCTFHDGGVDGHTGTLPTGFYANLEVEAPVLDTAASDNYTLTEIAVEKSVNSARQIVECGWAVNQSVFGNTQTHLFVSAWVNGSFLGWGTGFTDNAANTTHNHGTVLSTNVFQRCGIQYFNGDWWVWFGTTTGVGDWVGYFAGSNWTGASPTVTTFTNNDTSHAVGQVNADNDPTCTDMGDGVIGSASSGAYIASTSNVGGTTSAMTWSESPAYTGFDVAGLSARTARYGGPGC